MSVFLHKHGCDFSFYSLPGFSPETHCNISGRERRKKNAWQIELRQSLKKCYTLQDFVIFKSVHVHVENADTRFLSNEKHYALIHYGLTLKQQQTRRKSVIFTRQKEIKTLWR